METISSRRRWIGDLLPGKLAWRRRPFADPDLDSDLNFNLDTAAHTDPNANLDAGRTNRNSDSDLNLNLDAAFDANADSYLDTGRPNGHSDPNVDTNIDSNIHSRRADTYSDTDPGRGRRIRIADGDCTRSGPR